VITGCLQIKNDNYYVVLNLKENGKRKPKWIPTGLKTKGNKRKAEAELERLKKEYEQREAISAPKSETDMLFVDYLQSWLKTVKPSIARATYQSYSNMINARIDRYFRGLNVALAELTPNQIQEFYQTILDEDYTTNTVIHYHAVIRKALSSAVKKDMIPKNPADKVDKPKKNTFVAGHYSKEEMKTLFEAISDDPLQIVVAIAAYYGLRRSEVLGMRWSAIDFENKTISINHKVIEVEEDGKFVPVGEDVLKTRSSHRTLPLIPAVEKKLLEEKEKQAMYRRLFKKSYCMAYSDYVCVDQTGKLMRPNYVTEHFTWLLNKYELKRIRFHDLRHTCASLLLASGISMKQIQLWLGHSTFSTTADIYAHLDYSAQIESAEMMDGMYDTASEASVLAN